MDKKNITIVRSYSQKVNIGNYQTLDFFMSASAEISESEVAGKSKELDELCRNEVRKSIEEYLNKPKVNREELMKKGEDFQKKYNEGSALDEIKVEGEMAGDTTYGEHLESIK